MAPGEARGNSKNPPRKVCVLVMVVICATSVHCVRLCNAVMPHTQFVLHCELNLLSSTSWQKHLSEKHLRPLSLSSPLTVPPPALTAKVGTIKRKRQVRDILDHLDQGHTDDWFGSTPFKKSKFRNKVQSYNKQKCLYKTTEIWLP